MKGKRIRLWVALAAALCVLGAILYGSITKPVAEGSLGVGVSWKLDKHGSLSIYGKGDMRDEKGERGNTFYGHGGEILTATIEDGVTSVGQKAFLGCAGMTEIVIPDSVTRIGPSAFSGCSSLTRIDIPGGVTDIGESAFYECSGLTSVAIPAGVTQIEPHAFDRCANLTGVDIPEGVTKIGYSAFANCSALTGVALPASLTVIEKGAFENCAALTGIAIPAGVTDISDGAFTGCAALEGMTVDPGNPRYFALAEGALLERDTNALLWYPPRYVEGCEALVPEAFSKDEQLPEGTLDAEAILREGGVRVIPLDNSGAFDLGMFNCMPEECRTFDWRAADYALVKRIRWVERHDYVYEGTNVMAKGVYDTYTDAYLCAPDGAYGLLCSIVHHPPMDSSRGAMQGTIAGAKEIWEAVEGKRDTAWG